MYFPVIVIVTFFTIIARTNASITTGDNGILPEMPETVTVGEMSSHCDFGLSVSCCDADALEKPTEGGCFPLTEPGLRPFRFVGVCERGVPACCSSSMFDPEKFSSSESCEQISLENEDITPEDIMG
ncbi:hypothetical protein TWF481_002159 [Arthrobotrys musiformis]|uniref:Hydrophobin n=1 Tax=Arthrobotrys musiformis TaxID=47236 RepID=A0AAV9VYH2_9PEZI